MSIKSDNSATTSKTNNSDNTTYTYDTNINTNSNQNNNTNNQNSSDFTQSVNRSLDETKDNINRSIDESRNQIPRYNDIVNSYQEQSLQTAKEISEQYIESQKAVIGSLQSAWRPYSESFNGMVTSISSPDSMTRAYTKFVSSFADNAVSAIRLTNNIIFSNLDSWRSTLQQARDNSKQLSNLNVNAARTFEQNSRQIATAVSEANQSNQGSQDNNTNSSASSANNQSTYYNTTTTSTTKKQ
jgi:hypothetical protein